MCDYISYFPDPDIDLKACVACLSFIITSTIRFCCNSSALHSELQQLGLPREHSTSLKRVVDDNYDELTTYFKQQSLRSKWKLYYDCNFIIAIFS